MSKGRAVPPKIIEATEDDYLDFFAPVSAAPTTYGAQLDKIPIRPLKTDFQQWLWYYYRRHFFARFVCKLDLSPDGDRNDNAGYFLRHYWPDELGDPWSDKNFTAKWDEIEIYHNEDEYTDSPHYINLTNAYDTMQEWGFGYEGAKYTRWDKPGKNGDWKAEPASITTTYRFRILKRDNYRCQLCGATAADGARLEVDHIVPRSKGGSNFEWNLWLLCFSCNNGKRARDL